jgi:hypothetical protein
MQSLRLPSRAILEAYKVRMPHACHNRKTTPQVRGRLPKRSSFVITLDRRCLTVSQNFTIMREIAIISQFGVTQPRSAAVIVERSSYAFETATSANGSCGAVTGSRTMSRCATPAADSRAATRPPSAPVAPVIAIGELRSDIRPNDSTKAPNRCRREASASAKVESDGVPLNSDRNLHAERLER